MLQDFRHFFVDLSIKHGDFPYVSLPEGIIYPDVLFHGKSKKKLWMSMDELEILP